VTGVFGALLLAVGIGGLLLAVLAVCVRLFGGRGQRRQ